ncbi:MAG: 16S rRNA (adenine(1518)-N(6)/adenine(1519)-N(6))-dimethyltransferase RsmA [Bacilli bacterium]|nr:16S rRNA (adenine(1518)-N(6)/adenine(1519)-N(6))-dimethyltransferase RsmA [Bacilli bacterium]
MNIKEVKYLLDKYNLNAKKNFGQNFLVDDNILKKIASALNDKGYKSVIEVGPGLGSLTRYLVEMYDEVLCYEIDKDMIEVLNNTIEKNNLIIREGDFLKSDVSKDIGKFLKTNPCLIANLPYYITSPILLKLLEEVREVKDIVVMIQKEVAERFVARPNTKDYNALSVLIQYFTNAVKLFDVSPSAFVPAPKVTSAVIHLSYKEEELLTGKDLEFFLKFNRNIFKQRRKTFVNNVASSYNISKEEAAAILEQNGFSKTIRSEVLSVEEIVKLSLIFKEQLA